jgi:asparagine synthase (glutamine-hydrolysing)
VSGIAGVLHLDGRPADVELVERMTAAMTYRGLDGVRHEVDGPVALGHCMLCTTPESLRERQPLWDESRMYCLTMDGRVDNREELAGELRGRGAVLRDDTDAELVLKSYVTWGEDSPRRVIGDFAYVIWDKRARRLFCARDHLGIKPFYYYSDGKKFLWASELHCLFQDVAVPKAVNEGTVAEYLAGQVTSLTETAYRSITRLRRASFAVVDGRSIRVQEYWAIDPSRRLRCRDAEYVERFAEVFQQAARRSLRRLGPCGALLSGGVDSSTVVACCSELLRHGEALQAVSFVFPGSPADESVYIDAVVEHCGVTSHRLTPALGAEFYSENSRQYQAMPEPPNSGVIHCEELARSAGVKVVLTGLGGDEWFSPIPQERAYERCRRMLGRWPRTERLLRRVWGRPGVPRWIRAEFASRAGLRARIQPRRDPSWQRVLNHGSVAEALELENRAAARAGVEVRHPFHDRGVMEFAFSVPQDQKVRDGYSKYVVRQAMVNRLPGIVRTRLDKSEFSHVFVKPITAYAGLLSRSRSALAGWTVQREVDAMVRRFREAAECGMPLPHVWPLWKILSVELWLRGLEGGGQ